MNFIIQNEFRQKRAQKRADLKKQIQAAAESRQEADLALQELFFLDPTIFESDSVS